MTDRPLVQFPIAGTQPNRAGKPTARWIAEQAAGSGVFDIKAVDLAETDPPVPAEPGHPSTREYD
ncbi:hypothetical protein [Streptomyces sp. NBC_01089]|uniref:hypothetical protein n=1 Tax=Streptomyces sp. NBC_01089 TaxID=2903747 RepID=UPI00386FAA76|nr:hypothetical protein OG510_20250 [Streptomyces sp. NBC_01089]